jgi:hypothetical protein
VAEKCSQACGGWHSGRRGGQRQLGSEPGHCSEVEGITRPSIDLYSARWALQDNHGLEGRVGQIVTLTGAILAAAALSRLVASR